MVNTSRMPGMAFTAAKSVSLSCVPKAGACAIMAISMPSRRVSRPYRGAPVTILRPSTLRREVPIMLNESLGLSSTVSGTAIPAAAAAISP